MLLEWVVRVAKIMLVASACCANTEEPPGFGVLSLHEPIASVERGGNKSPALCDFGPGTRTSLHTRSSVTTKSKSSSRSVGPGGDNRGHRAELYIMDMHSAQSVEICRLCIYAH